MIMAIASAAAVALCGVAAYTDWRTGTIPNAVTLPPLAIAPIVYFALDGPGLAGASLISAALCGAVPYLLFRRDALGGGDVKLLAAVGALIGAQVGLEGELFAFGLASVWALVVTARRGGLRTLLGNALFLALNPFLPRRWRREVAPQRMVSLRLGAFVLGGVCAAVLLRTVAGTQV